MKEKEKVKEGMRKRKLIKGRKYTTMIESRKKAEGKEDGTQRKKTIK